MRLEWLREHLQEVNPHGLALEDLVPPFSLEDEGKVLGLVVSEDLLSITPEWLVVETTEVNPEPIAELPSYTVSDSGKFLRVNSLGNLEWFTYTLPTIPTVLSAYLTSAQSVSGTSETDIPGLSLTLADQGVYSLSGLLAISGDGTDGKFSWTGPTSTFFGRYSYAEGISPTYDLVQQISSFSLTTLSATTASNTYYTFSGFIKITSTGGTLQFQACTNHALGDLTVDIGSWLQAIKMN